MFYQFPEDFAFSIKGISVCDFNGMLKMDNDQVMLRSGKSAARLRNYVDDVFGIENRYWCHPQQTSLDLARDALRSLVNSHPEIPGTIDFLIFAGISSPLPATTLSTLLSEEFQIDHASCWDVKSGCSTGLLALLQGLGLLRHGARSGVIVASENLSRFANPEELQIAMTIGDGACALYITADEDWRVRAALHGTDSRGSSFMRVPTGFPDNISGLPPYYHFRDKPKAVQLLRHHWLSSLEAVLSMAGVEGKDVNHYVAHQIDTQKNQMIAEAFGIPGQARAMNFSHYGNMGCPTVFINLHEWWRCGHQPKTGEIMVLQAVGGGISWAAMCLEKI